MAHDIPIPAALASVNEAIIVRRVMTTRRREAHPAIGQPEQDTMPPNSSANEQV